MHDVFYQSHNGHVFSESVDLRKQMTNDVVGITSGVEKCREMLEHMEKEKKDFIEQLEKTECKINEKAEQLKQMIDAHREVMINELSSMKQKRIVEIESLREEIERQLLTMERYKKCVDEVRQTGTAWFIARAASGLHDIADKLLMFDAIERTLADLGHADVMFTSSEYVTDDVNKTLGHLCLSVIKTGESI